jgi:hypothetical protein
MAEISLREARTVIDEELAKLSEKYRAPLVLCYLEGATRDEAAQQLGWSLGTLKRRLEQGRELLRERLARRGLTLSAALAAGLLAQNAGQGAVPAPLVDTTVRAALLFAAGKGAAAEMVSAGALALLQGVTRAMFWTKFKLATVLLLAVGLCTVSAGLLTHQAAAKQAETPQLPAGAAKQPATKEIASQGRPAASTDDTDASTVVSGLVLAPDGKPAPGAKVYLARNTYKSKADLGYNPKAFAGGPPTYMWPDTLPEKVDVPLRATTGPDGRFRFTARRAELGRGAVVVAQAPGCGPDWTELSLCNPAADITLRLAQDDVPINGRVLDLEGQPIAGVAVTVLRVEKPEAIFSLDMVKLNVPGKVMVVKKDARGAAGAATPGAHLEAEALETPVSVKTGPDGRFRLTGFGRDRLVRLRLHGPSIENDYVYVQVRPNPAAGSVKDERAYYATFDYVAAPNRPIVGTVREKGSGKPLPGVTVGTGVLFAIGKASVRTTTDAEGRYRLEGAGRAEQRHYIVAGGIPYFSSFKVVEETSGSEPLTVDFELERGIAVRGRLTDQATGKPVRGLVGYFALPDNPHVKDFTSLGTFPLVIDGRGEVGPDGSFTVAALPGPGLLCVWVDDDRFPRTELAGWDGQPLKAVPFPVNPAMFHAVIRINPSEKDPKSTTCNITLEPGRTVTGSVVGPDGQPLSGVLALGLTAVLPSPRYQAGFVPQPPSQMLATATFTAYGLNPRQPRAVVLIHPEKGLGKVQLLRGDEAGPLTVRLEPLGAFTGRVVDAQGRPWDGLRLYTSLSLNAADLKVLPYEALGRGFLLPGGLNGLFRHVAATDRDGRFRTEGLLPGLKYELQTPVFKKVEKPKLPLMTQRDLSVEPGKAKDLGELRSDTTPEEAGKELNYERKK